MEGFTVKELQVLARKKGIPCTGMKKAEIIHRLKMSEGILAIMGRKRSSTSGLRTKPHRRSSSLCAGKTCSPTKVCNPASGRCVVKAGKIGQAVLWKALRRVPSPARMSTRAHVRKTPSPKFTMDEPTRERLMIAKTLYRDSNVPIPRVDDFIEKLAMWRTRVFSPYFIEELTDKFSKVNNPLRTFALLIHGELPDRSREKINPYLATIAFMKMFKRGVLKRLVDSELYHDIMNYCMNEV